MTRTWIRVNHLEKSITFFNNNGEPFKQNGAYMSKDYFKVLQRNMPQVKEYKVINKVDSSSNEK